LKFGDDSRVEHQQGLFDLLKGVTVNFDIWVDEVILVFLGVRFWRQFHHSTMDFDVSFLDEGLLF
jgi:hypothetical protein